MHGRQRKRAPGARAALGRAGRDGSFQLVRLWDVRCAGCAGELEQCQGVLDSATPVECGLMALRLKLGCFVLGCSVLGCFELGCFVLGRALT